MLQQTEAESKCSLQIDGIESSYDTRFSFSIPKIAEILRSQEAELEAARANLSKVEAILVRAPVGEKYFWAQETARVASDGVTALATKVCVTKNELFRLCCESRKKAWMEDEGLK